MNGIRQLRALHGLKQADIAKPVGVSQQMISLWEHGYEVKPEHKEKLREFFDKQNAETVQTKS